MSKFKEILNEEDIKTIKDATKEYVDSLTRAASESELQKSIADRIKDDELLPPKIFKKVCGMAFRDSADKFSAESTEILDMAELVGIYTNDPYEKKGE